MEKINFNYSLKNILTPTEISNQLMLMNKIESVIKQIRWKVHVYLKKDTRNITYKNYGFKTRKYPSQCKELQKFEKFLLDIIKLIKFRISKENWKRPFRIQNHHPMSMPLLTRLLTSINFLHSITKGYYMEISPNAIKNHQPVWKNL